MLEINLSIVPSNVPDHIGFIEHVAPGKPVASRMETTEVEINYLDTFLAFLGMTFGPVSVVPVIFSTQGRIEVRNKDCREPRRQQQAMTRRGRQAGTTQKL